MEAGETHLNRREIIMFDLFDRAVQKARSLPEAEKNVNRNYYA